MQDQPNRKQIIKYLWPITSILVCCIFWVDPKQFKFQLQVWSFVSSIASIAWSFSSNYSRRKFGQMSVLSRAVFFSYILIAVVSRITMIEFFLISCGKFVYIYLIVGTHVMIVFCLDVWLNWASFAAGKHWFWKGKDFVIRAFSSMYIHFPVTEDSNQKEEDLRYLTLFWILLSFFLPLVRKSPV